MPRKADLVPPVGGPPTWVHTPVAGYFYPAHIEYFYSAKDAHEIKVACYCKIRASHPHRSESP